jgi:uncharacterized protein (DUF1800 family)
MGYTPADVARVKSIGYAAWLDEQFAMPEQFNYLAKLNAVNPQVDAREGRINELSWVALVKSADQLRQRQMYTLSQIMVASAKDGAVYYWGRSFATYLDTLQAHSFGNYRNLLEAVALNPAMGNFLTYIYNRKEDPVTGQVPDQNFSREMMQLFSIGLWELNLDGTRKLDAAGKPIPTYTRDDVVGVSRVMTGFAPRGATTSDWNNYYCFCQKATDIPAQSSPMVGYPAYHSTSEKKFLGVTIPAGSSNPEADLKTLLDRVAGHPNVGPFIGKQLIQKLVTSNPSPAYVARVASVFNNNGAGVRGDLKAVLKAVLLDNEARSATVATQPDFGRIKEPILRMTQLMRSLNAQTGIVPHTFNISQWQFDRRKGLWQSPFYANSVFNFYYPDFSPSGTAIAAAGKVAPESQLTHTTSIDDNQDFFGSLLNEAGLTDCCSEAQRNSYYTKLDYSTLLPLVATPDALLDQLALRFMAGPMSPPLRTAIKNEMAGVSGDRSPSSGIVRGNAQLKLARAIHTMLSSPDFIVQK